MENTGYNIISPENYLNIPSEETFKQLSVDSIIEDYDDTIYKVPNEKHHL